MKKALVVVAVLIVLGVAGTYLFLMKGAPAEALEFKRAAEAPAAPSGGPAGAGEGAPARKMSAFKTEAAEAPAAAPAEAPADGDEGGVEGGVEGAPTSGGAAIAPASPPPPPARPSATAKREAPARAKADALAERAARDELRAQAQQSQLTAGDWDDNLNFPTFLKYRGPAVGQQHPYGRIDVSTSRVIEVKNAKGEPIRGARVRVLEGNRQLLAATTPADGRVLFVPSLDGASKAAVTVQVEGTGQVSKELSVGPGGEHSLALVLNGAPYRRASAMDIAFVVDTTGSMSDELRYLQREIGDIAARVQSGFQPLDLRFALVIYRDAGDQYVVRTFDFGPLAKFQAALADQVANGGGDEPEAVEQALAAMGQLSWSSGDASKVAFLVADAPAHPENAAKLFKQMDSARQRGIRLYTVAASGVTDEAELEMRTASQLTLARYIFLTDDSGIGNSHAEPHIPCYLVQKLAGLLAHTLAAEVTGTRPEIPPGEVVRTVGNPQQGSCKGPNGIAYRL